ncbi:conserved hypothetical protein [uncultured Eubacteriales bacterium]|uniref:Cytidylate kinase n=1 Tax=uncultured Eubacteriales bacterium TaxID=172733 RepID=A0A212KGN6_9FIRM|nr:conserved hypothetical protein [uncultured Eubacteriales bacterium]
MDKHIVVTISREFGAEGYEIGKVLADRLGIKLYDKDILGKAAQKKGTEKVSLQDADEKVSERFFEPYLMLSMGLSNKSDQLFEMENSIIRNAAASESCVIVGRLSDYLLRNEPYVIKVLVFAPLEFRVDNIKKKYDMSENAAKKMVSRMDMARKDYCSYYSNGKWKQTSGKDIFLNRETLGVKGCADILEAAVTAKAEQLYAGV